MNEPWFDPNLYAWIPGTLLGGIGGGVGGPLMGKYAPQGKLKGLVMGFHFSVIAISAVLLCLGIFGWATGQPYLVWFSLALPGLIGVVVFGSLTPVLRLRYQQAELRRTMANDM